MARAVYTISIKPLSKDFLKFYLPFEPVETEGFLEGVVASIEGMVWAFRAQLPFKMPPGLIEMTAARLSPPGLE